MALPDRQQQRLLLYNPQQAPKNQLLDSFPLRQRLFQRLYDTLRSAPMDVPEQHYLFTGQSGMGKTTLLLRLAYELERDAGVNQRLVPLVFSEEEYGIRRLFNLWERCIALLAERDGRFGQEVPRPDRAVEEDEGAYERALFEHLQHTLRQYGKKIILFIANFGDIVEKLTEHEAHRLRKVLQTSPDLRLVGAAVTAPSAFYRYDHPFYEFFSVTALRGLDEQDTVALLRHLADQFGQGSVTRIVREQPARIDTLRRITGGVVRNIVLLFDILAERAGGTASGDVLLLLDRITPLYKSRMDALSQQQQAIAQAMALRWDASNVKEMADATHLGSKTISAQLQQLEKNGFAQRIPTHTKNNLYIVADRFFNIWFLLRNGRPGDTDRVLWLIEFMEKWYGKDMLKHPAVLHRSVLKAQREIQGSYVAMPDDEWHRPYSQAFATKQQRRVSASKAMFGSALTAEQLDQKAAYFASYFMLMLAEGEHKWLLDVFESEGLAHLRLKERFKPIYYALLKHLAHPDALRMGQELAETVDDILAMAANYREGIAAAKHWKERVL